MDEVERRAFEKQIIDMTVDFNGVLRAHRDKGVSIRVVPAAMANLVLGYINGALKTKEQRARFIVNLVDFLTRHATIEPVTRNPKSPVIVKQ